MGVVQLIFLLLALLIVIGFLFPGWRFTAGPAFTPNSLIGLVISLIVLFIVYLLVIALFGGSVGVVR